MLPTQITLRNIFISTVLWALWFCALLADVKNGFMYIVTLFQVIGPFLAFGALIGRPWLGAIFGIVAIASIAVHFYIQIYYFHMPL